MSLDDAVEELAADEAEFAINCCRGATCEVPGLAGVVRERRIGVLKVGDGNWSSLLAAVLILSQKSFRTEPVVHPEVWRKVPHRQV